MKRLVNKTRDCILATDLTFAKTFSERARGLSGRDELRPGEAMAINRCRQVHTYGMQFPIDVLFINKKGLVVAASREIPPGKLTPIVWRSRTVVELDAGAIERTCTDVGDETEVDDSEEGVLYNV